MFSSCPSVRACGILRPACRRPLVLDVEFCVRSPISELNFFLRDPAGEVDLVVVVVVLALNSWRCSQ